ncbi:MAG: AAA family ATPase [Lachnospiraceae bacterium]|nr:AAA family ATPase [Lachnospiraceae bacterium]MCM1230680.1 AAA family ATPase [Ruminococcus flavefaciens]
MNIGQKILNGAKEKALKTLVTPLDNMLDEQLTDISTTIGAFIIRYVKGKYQRSISFTIGLSYSDKWMEEALYGILYQYNNIKKSARLELSNKVGYNDGSGMYYRLDDGTHNLRYRNYEILLNIQTESSTTITGRISNPKKVYTIITYNLDPKFVKDFERDMIAHRNSLLKIKADSPVVNVYQDYHESDGWTYWEKCLAIPKRRIDTIYLPLEQKKQLVNTINAFFASKDYYKKHGIAHNLKILLYGPPGPQPVDIMIPTPDGMKRFGDLQIGDQVFDRLGLPTTVTEIHPKGIQDVYEVKFLNGRKTKCTVDHLWEVSYRSHGEWKEDVVSLKYIMDTSTLLSAPDGSMLVTGEKRYSVPTNEPVKFNSRPLLVDPYVMGILITNGCLTDEYLRISQPTDEVPKRVSEILNLQYEERSTDQCDYSYIFYTNEGKRVKTDDILHDYPEVNGIKSPYRQIPEDFLFNSIENRISLLQGLMDGDGSIVERSDRKWESPIISYSTTSKKLAEQIVWLCRSLGFDCYSYPDKREKYTSGYCVKITIQVIPDEMMDLFRVSYKLERAARCLDHYNELVENGEIKWTRYRIKSKITSIRKLDKQEEVMCIKVDNPEHLYLTEDFIVTHNTGKDSIAKMIASEWNRNIYYVTGGKEGRFIPNAITDADDDVNYPLLLISDIDKYPFLINEPKVDIKDGEAKDEKMKYKQCFGAMINALDGVLSAEDRIIVMTTNHIEEFSETILRPGRVDLMMEIGYVTPEVMRKYVWDFYQVQLPQDIKLKSDKTSIANMQADVVFNKMSAEDFIKKYVK